VLLDQSLGGTCSLGVKIGIGMSWHFRRDLGKPERKKWEVEVFEITAGNRRYLRKPVTSLIVNLIIHKS
jgi:hypothetical protein